MYTCPKCSHTFEESIHFCPICGTNATGGNDSITLIMTQSVADNSDSLEEKRSSVAKKIAGMILAIWGFTVALIEAFCFFFCFIRGLCFIGTDYHTYSLFAIVAITVTFIYPILSMPLSLVGLNLSKSCIAQSDTSQMCKVGRTLGFIGFIISSALPFFSLVISATL